MFVEISNKLIREKAHRKVTLLIPMRYFRYLLFFLAIKFDYLINMPG